ncbi:paraquat-inducible protein B [Gluconacetobacter johannae DSM 13595]|uniref:MCE family protein n=1 Tax=Gluconacetobacter johannae TaxID=112140 RepID=A0A7W4J521_9PROT|nr:MlaD family protein [Gluconacetobacter johannae]MBB2174741.1 MCE family protein [Gluconacetobacter johannae]GBQ86598.1 paraquat-inducible protein B [Gluconacetobacter johannae DSM 13595]
MTTSPHAPGPPDRAGRVTTALFVAGGLAIGLGILGSIGQFGIAARTERAVIVFDTPVAGLGPGAPVTFRGVALGRVEQVAALVDPARSSVVVPVTIRIQPDRIRLAPHTPRRVTVAYLVEQGLEAELHSQSVVTGRIGIDLDFTAPDPSRRPPPHHPGLSSLVEIPAHLSAWQVLRHTLTTLPVHAMAAEARQAVAHGRHLAADLSTTLPPLRDRLDALRADATTLGNTLHRTERRLGRKLATTRTNLAHMSATARRQADARGADIHALAASSRAALAEARQTRDDLCTLTDAHSPARADLAAAQRDIAAAGPALHRAVRAVERNPAMLVSAPRGFAP